MTDLNPDYLPPNRRKAAEAATRQLRMAMIGHRVGVELRAAVVAVLLVVDVYRAPVWAICALFFAPLLMNGAVLLLATALAMRRPRVRSDDEP